jgi:hypothetical protein
LPTRYRRAFEIRQRFMADAVDQKEALVAFDVSQFVDPSFFANPRYQRVCGFDHIPISFFLVTGLL